MSDNMTGSEKEIALGLARQAIEMLATSKMKTVVDLGGESPDFWKGVAAVTLMHASLIEQMKRITSENDNSTRAALCFASTMMYFDLVQANPIATAACLALRADIRRLIAEREASAQ